MRHHIHGDPLWTFLLALVALVVTAFVIWLIKH